MELEILKYSYWEHFKRAKELSMVLPLNSPDRVAIEKELKVMIKEINSVSAKSTYADYEGKD